MRELPGFLVLLKSLVLGYLLISCNQDQTVEPKNFSRLLQGRALQVGFAAEPFPESKGIYLAGYVPYREAEPKVDPESPVSIRAVWLQPSVKRKSSQKDGILLLTLDTLGLGGVTITQIKKIIEKRLGIAPGLQFIYASHTHTGPDLFGLWGGSTKQFRQEVLAALLRVVESARKDASRASVRLGSVETKAASYNRRYGGHTPKHNKVHQLLFSRRRNKDISILSYGSHPVGMGTQTRTLSNDYIGLMMQGLEKKTGHHYLFLPGALGDINPPRPDLREDETRLGKDDFRSRTRQFAQQLISDIGKMTLKTIPVRSIQITSRGLNLEMDHFLMNLFNRLGWIRLRRDSEARLSGTTSVLRFGNSLKIVAAPGEILKQYERNLQNQSKVPVWVTSLCNGTLGYFIPEKKVRFDNSTEEVFLLDPTLGDRWEKTVRSIL